MGPRVGLDGRKISSPPEFDPGPSSPYTVALPTELPGPQGIWCTSANPREELSDFDSLKSGFVPSATTKLPFNVIHVSCKKLVRNIYFNKCNAIYSGLLMYDTAPTCFGMQRPSAWSWLTKVRVVMA